MPACRGPLRGRIAERGRTDGNAEIYVMNADGTDQRRLTSQPTPDSEPVFSPDGSKCR